VADLKKANHLFNSRDFGIRKTFIIPMDPVQYEKYQKEIDHQNAKEQARREEITSDFIEKTNTDKEIATVYLTDSHFHLERALERYHLENMTTTEPFSVPISRPHTTYVQIILGTVPSTKHTSTALILTIFLPLLYCCIFDVSLDCLKLVLCLHLGHISSQTSGKVIWTTSSICDTVNHSFPGSLVL
jgi:hypothetical protein